MANYFVDQIVSGGTLPPTLLEGLRALAPEVRQALLRDSLIEKFGTGRVFKIRNTSVFLEDIAAICNNAYVDPLTQEHNQDYYMGSLSEAETASLERTAAQYRTLADVLANPLDARIPMYLTATQGELRIHLAKANTYFTAHPEVTLVLQAAVGETTFSLRNPDLPELPDLPVSLKKLSLVGNHVISIGDGFLQGCIGLTALDFSPLSKVTSIGHRFLYGCTGLTALDLSSLSKVTSIGAYFLYGCAGLTTLDPSPLSNVTSIGSHFLYECAGLTALDLSPLSKITTIGNHFLHRCAELTTINLSLLSNVTSIGESFLEGCEGLNPETRAAVAEFLASRR